MRKYILILCLLFFSCGKKYNDSEKAIGYQDTVDKVERILNQIPPADFKGRRDSTLKPDNAFDPNTYFSALHHIKLKPGYVLDYTLYNGGLGGNPILYARKINDKPFNTLHEYTEKLKELGKMSDKSYKISSDNNPYSVESAIELTDSDESYLEYIIFIIMSEQFYLMWHSNYNDYQVVFTKEKLAGILNDISDISDSLKAKVPSLSLEPSVVRKDSVIEVSLPVFSHWGGLVRRRYNISRSDFHRIRYLNWHPSTIDKKDILLKYDCGIMF